MGDETAAKDIVVHQPVDLVGDSTPEPREPKTVKEIVEEFRERRHRIRVFKESRILFDPKQLPGVTPQESLEFLFKGLRIEDPDVRRKILGAGEAIRRNFEDFIDSLTEQNNVAAVAEAWNAKDADSAMKMGLQWEFQQDRTHLIDDYLMEKAGDAAKDIRALDALVKKSSGDTIFVIFDKGYVHLAGATRLNGHGLDFTEDPDDPPYRRLFIPGSTSYYGKNLDRYERNIQTSDGLVIPFEAKGALERASDADYWQRYHDSDGFWGRRGRVFDPENNFLFIITGREISEIREPGMTNYDFMDRLVEALKPPKPTSVQSSGRRS